MIILAPFAPEYELAKERFGSEHKIILLGIGPRNALARLQKLGIPSWASNLMLFGFAGSNNLDVGTEVYANKSLIHQFHADFQDEPHILRRPDIEGAPEFGVPCYSSSDFVVETKVEEDAIFDMELAFLTTCYPNITAWRIVSDKLSLQQFDEFLGR